MPSGGVIVCGAALKRLEFGTCRWLEINILHINFVFLKKIVDCNFYLRNILYIVTPESANLGGAAWIFLKFGRSR